MLAIMIKDDTLILITVKNNKIKAYSVVAALYVPMLSTGSCQCGSDNKNSQMNIKNDIVQKSSDSGLYHLY